MNMGGTVTLFQQRIGVTRTFNNSLGTLCGGLVMLRCGFLLLWCQFKVSTRRQGPIVHTRMSPYMLSAAYLAAASNRAKHSTLNCHAAVP